MPPNNASRDSSALLARLKVESAAWQALLDVLQEEEQALIAGDADRVALLNSAKLTQLQSVSDHARGRHGDLLAAGHTPNHAGMDAWLAQYGQPDLRARWRNKIDPGGKITVSLLEGPFTYLEGTWNFMPLREDASKI